MENLSANVAIFSIPATIPGLLMIAGHYFPWHHTPLGKLTENQSRIYGVLGIILPAMAAVALSDALGVTLGAWTVIALVWVAAISAGTSTIWAWGFDAKMKLHQDITEEKHRTELLKGQIEGEYAEARDIH